MGKQRKEEAPPAGAPAWMATFSDLMNLLLCFFVMLFAMSNTEESKLQEMVAAMNDTIGIFQAGSTSIGEGILISNGVSQLNELDQYINNMGQKADSEADGEDYNEYDQGNPGTNGNNQGGQSNQGNQNNQGNKGDNVGVKPDNGQDVEQGSTEGDKNDGGQSENIGQSQADKNDGGKSDENGDDLEELLGDIGKLQGILDDEMLKENELLAEEVGEALAESQIADQVDLSFTAQYIELTMNGALLFDSGSAYLTDAAKVVLDKVGAILERFGSDSGIIEIEGHTDNVPINSAQYPSNEELSSARALSVFYYLIENTSLDASQMKHAGMGERVPVSDNTTPEGRSRNRRVEIRIYNPAQY